MECLLQELHSHAYELGTYFEMKFFWWRVSSSSRCTGIWQYILYLLFNLTWSLLLRCFPLVGLLLMTNKGAIGEGYWVGNLPLTCVSDHTYLGFRNAFISYLYTNSMCWLAIYCLPPHISKWYNQKLVFFFNDKLSRGWSFRGQKWEHITEKVPLLGIWQAKYIPSGFTSFYAALTL